MNTRIPRGHRMSPLNHEPEAVSWAIKRSGLTQQDVAEQAGISKSLLSEICKGTRNAKQDVLSRIAGVLNCPVVVLEAKVATDAKESA